MSWIDICKRSSRQVRIYLAPGCRGEFGKIELSSGTRVADPRDVHDRDYEEGARIPREPWRLPTEEETAYLFSNDPPEDHGRSIGIVRLSDPFSRQIGGSGLRTEPEDISRQILSSLDLVCDVGAGATCIGPISNPPNMKTTTSVGDERRKYIGLHVDSWKSDHLDCRDLANNRICVNIGSGARYFLFLPISIVDITRIMSEEIGAEHIPVHSASELGLMFMELFSRVPVIRCRLAPYEAYIAPTENLIHDGSSEGQQHRDQQLTVLGTIRIRHATVPGG